MYWYPGRCPGKMEGIKEGTRSGLYYEGYKILKAKRPKYSIIENVKNLTSKRFKNQFESILKDIEELEYTNYWQILNAKDYGIPQNRERIMIVGFLNHNINFEFPKPTGIKTKVGNILESNVDSSFTISDKLWAGHQRRKIQNKLNGKGFGYGLFNANSPYTNTISARYYKDGSEILVEQKNKNPRKITPREAARLQGFPEDFIIDKVSNAQAYKQFGNSVCVPVITAVAEQIKLAMEV